MHKIARLALNLSVNLAMATVGRIPVLRSIQVRR
jgi:hypothetical protein